MEDQQTDGITIVGFEAENFKRLKAIKITPRSHVVKLAGANKQGKSSALDAMSSVLSGGKGMKDISEPIHRGKKKAHAIIDLGNMVATRRWSAKGSTLTVIGEDGTKFTSPQKVLDEITGRFAFDPLVFAGLSPKEQTAALLELVTLEIDLDKIASQRQAAFEERTAVNRETKTLTAQLEGLPIPDTTPPDEEVSSASILAELDLAQDLAQSNAARREELSELLAKATDLQAAIEIEQKELESMVERGKRMREGVDALVDPDPTEMRARLLSVEETNKAVRAYKENSRITALLDDSEEKALALSETIQALDDNKARGLAEATFPIDGLSFGDDGVTYNDLPFSQASDAERLEVSFAIAMALNPTLKVIQIRNGSLLDSTSMAQIEEMARKNGFQVWMELVDESGEVGIVFEDGCVVADNQ